MAILGGIKCDDSLRVARNLIQKGSIDRIAMVGVVGNLMLWASGHDIGENNKQFIRESLGDAFDETWRDSETLVRDYPKLLFLRQLNQAQGHPVSRDSWQMFYGCESCEGTGLQYRESVQDIIGEPVKNSLDASGY